MLNPFYVLICIMVIYLVIILLLLNSISFFKYSKIEYSRKLYICFKILLVSILLILYIPTLIGIIKE